jgi:hypothetical protein
MSRDIRQDEMVGKQVAEFRQESSLSTLSRREPRFTASLDELGQSLIVPSLL